MILWSIKLNDLLWTKEWDVAKSNVHNFHEYKLELSLVRDSSRGTSGMSLSELVIIQKRQLFANFEGNFSNFASIDQSVFYNIYI